jgi:hypothetical protein
VMQPSAPSLCTLEVDAEPATGCLMTRAVTLPGTQGLPISG